MVLCVTGSLQDGNQGAITALFWALLIFFLVIAMPALGFGTLSGEIKGNTLDLLLLTRLTAFGIAFGKWAALFLQGALVVCSVLPYLILRYFVGGMNLTLELIAMAWVLFANGLLTAGAVAFSPYIRYCLVRIVLLFVLIFGMYPVGALISGYISNPGATRLGMTIAAVVIGPLIILGLLNFAAWAIEPTGVDNTPIEIPPSEY